MTGTTNHAARLFNSYTASEEPRPWPLWYNAALDREGKSSYSPWECGFSHPWE